MFSYTFFNPDGSIRTIVRASQQQDFGDPGYDFVHGEPPGPANEYRVDLATGHFVKIEKVIVESYSVKRARAYPSITDQLDALWHAMDKGLLPKVPDFYEPIAAVKAAHPKE